MKITHPTDTNKTTICDLRRTVLLGRIESTRPESVDHLLHLADLALSNDELVVR